MHVNTLSLFIYTCSLCAVDPYDEVEAKETGKTVHSILFNMYDSLYWFWWFRILHLQASCSEVIVHILCSDRNWCQWLDPQPPGRHWHMPSHSNHHWETSAGNHCENFYNFWSLGLYFAPLNSALSQIASYICRHWGSYHACTVFWLRIKIVEPFMANSTILFSPFLCAEKQEQARLGQDLWEEQGSQ